MAAPRKRTAAKTAAKEGKDQAVSAAETVLEAAESGKTEAKKPAYGDGMFFLWGS